MGLYSSAVEIAPKVFRLSLAPSSHFEFAQFLLNDDSPTLVHAGKSSLFEPLEELVLNSLAGRSLKYIVFSHVEADESGAANKWLKRFPEAKVVCNKIANISLDDTLIRPAEVIQDGEAIDIGDMRLKMVETPHFPHNWDAHMWFEEKNQILFSSDFCCQGGICDPVVERDISDSIIDFYTKGGFIPYGASSNKSLEKLDALNFKTIAPMHGSTITGTALRDVFDKVKSDLVTRS